MAGAQLHPSGARCRRGRPAGAAAVVGVSGSGWLWRPCKHCWSEPCRWFVALRRSCLRATSASVHLCERERRATSAKWAHPTLTTNKFLGINAGSSFYVAFYRIVSSRRLRLPSGDFSRPLAERRAPPAPTRAKTNIPFLSIASSHLHPPLVCNHTTVLGWTVMRPHHVGERRTNNRHWDYRLQTRWTACASRHCRASGSAATSSLGPRD